MKRKALNELFEEFYNEYVYASRLSEATLRGYKSTFILFNKIMPNVIYPQHLNRKAMITFFKRLDQRERIVGKGKKVKGVKSTTIVTYWSKLSKFFTWLKNNKELVDNPLDTMDRPSVDYLNRKYIEEKDLVRIFTAISYNILWKSNFLRVRNITIFTMALCCGLRIGELSQLKMLDICMKNRVVKISADISKSKMNRTIPLNTVIFNKLKEYLALRHSSGYRSEHLWVTDNKDKELTKHGFTHLMKKVVKESTIKVHWHRFRHTFAVNIINNGTDITKLKQLMGHKDIRMTSSYVRCLPCDSLRSDVEAVEIGNLL